MADISKIRLENATYNIKDTNARGRLDILELKGTIMIGDSYGVGTTAGGEITGWCDRLKTLMNLSNDDYFKFVEGGAGFVQKGQYNHNFLELLQNSISFITDTSKIKNIIVCAGYNDKYQNSSLVNSAIYSFINYCKSNFSNATIYIGMCGVSSAVTTEGANIRKSLYNDILRCYQNCINYGAIYLNNIEFVLRNYGDFMSSDTIHPNNSGYDNLAFHINQCLLAGSCDVNMPHKLATITLSNSNSTFNIYNKMENGNILINSENTSITFTTAISSVSDSIDLGTYDLQYFRDLYNTNFVDVSYYLQSSASHPAVKYYGGIGRLHFRQDGHLILETRILLNEGDPFLNVAEVYYVHIYPFEKTLVL